jgi:hypothetical protein
VQFRLLSLVDVLLSYGVDPGRWIYSILPSTSRPQHGDTVQVRHQYYWCRLTTEFEKRPLSTCLGPVLHTSVTSLQTVNLLALYNRLNMLTALQVLLRGAVVSALE